jgi:hypothetical protein
VRFVFVGKNRAFSEVELCQASRFISLSED